MRLQAGLLKVISVSELPVYKLKSILYKRRLSSEVFLLVFGTYSIIHMFSKIFKGSFTCSGFQSWSRRPTALRIFLTHPSQILKPNALYYMAKKKLCIQDVQSYQGGSLCVAFPFISIVWDHPE